MQKRRTRPAARATAVAAALATLTVAGAVIAPSAQAQSGYRVCPYVNNQDGWTELSSNKALNAYVAVKIKKGGTCPVVTKENFRWLAAKNPQPTAQPVTPITCESHPLYKKIDLCKRMSEVRSIYEFRVYDDGSGITVATGRTV